MNHQLTTAKPTTKQVDDYDMEKIYRKIEYFKFDIEHREIMNFGKYKNQTIGDILKNDKSYLHWVRKNVNNKLISIKLNCYFEGDVYINKFIDENKEKMHNGKSYLYIFMNDEEKFQNLL